VVVYFRLASMSDKVFRNTSGITLIFYAEWTIPAGLEAEVGVRAWLALGSNPAAPAAWTGETPSNFAARKAHPGATRGGDWCSRDGRSAAGSAPAWWPRPEPAGHGAMPGDPNHVRDPSRHLEIDVETRPAAHAGR
jgi:hypothetical protein